MNEKFDFMYTFWIGESTASVFIMQIGAQLIRCTTNLGRDPIIPTVWVSLLSTDVFTTELTSRTDSREKALGFSQDLVFHSCPGFGHNLLPSIVSRCGLQSLPFFSEH